MCVCMRVCMCCVCFCLSVCLDVCVYSHSYVCVMKPLLLLLMLNEELTTFKSVSVSLYMTILDISSFIRIGMALITKCIVGTY